MPEMKTTVAVLLWLSSHWIGCVASVSVHVDTPPLPVTQRTANHETVQLTRTLLTHSSHSSQKSRSSKHPPHLVDALDWLSRISETLTWMALTILLCQHLLREREWSTFTGELPLASPLTTLRSVIRIPLVHSQDLSIVSSYMCLVSSVHSHPLL